MSIRIEYEDLFAEFVKVEYARAFMLGRHGLVTLLKALGVGSGDNIGVCAFTCLSVVEAVKVVGAVPIYLDIDESLCIAPQEILKQPLNFLKVIILQHTFGNPGKLDELLASCKKIGALVIEDCAHALGCYWNGRPLGQFGEGAIYSFQWGKPYTTGQGGMVTLNSPELFNKVDMIIKKWSMPQTIKDSVSLEVQRNLYTFFSKTSLEFYLRSLYKSLRNKFFHNTSFKLDRDFKFDNGYIKIPGALTSRDGLKKIKAYTENMYKRRKTVNIIERFLKQRNIPLCKCSNSAEITMTRYPLFVKNKIEVLKISAKKYLDIAGWYDSPVHPLANDDLLKVGYMKNMSPNAENYIKKLIHLPTNNSDEKRISLMLDTIFDE